MSASTTCSALPSIQSAEKIRDSLGLAIIDGELHSSNGRYYEKITSEQLETKIIDELRHSSTPINKGKVKDIAYFLQHDSCIPQYDPAESHGYIGFSNGVLDCNSEQLFLHNYNYANQLLLNQHLALSCCYPDIHYYTYGSLYEPSPSTPVADNFFCSAACGDPKLVIRIWEMIGYLVAPDTMAKKLFLLQGPSNTGKSVLGRFIQSIFPKGQVTGLSLSQLGDTNLPAEFMGSRLNLSMDLFNGKVNSKAIERIKLLTGNDLISQNIKFKDARSYNGQCKFLFSTNHPVQLKQWDDAFFQRIVSIPLSNVISQEHKDLKLLDKLIAEKDGIVSKALYYYQELKKRNYLFSGQFLFRWHIYDQFPPLFASQVDPRSLIQQFVQEDCLFTGLQDSFTYTDDLHQAFLRFCVRKGCPIVISTNGFGQHFSSLCADKVIGDRKREGSRNGRGFRCVELINDTGSSIQPTNFSGKSFYNV